MNSAMKICNDNEVCHPLQTKGKGNPVNIVSGASSGNVYHHLVSVAKEIIVNGIIILKVSDFIWVSV